MKVDLEFLEKNTTNKKKISKLLVENCKLTAIVSDMEHFDTAWIDFKFGNGGADYNFCYQTNLKNITETEKRKKRAINNFIKKWKKINIEEINQLKEV